MATNAAKLLGISSQCIQMLMEAQHRRAYVGRPIAEYLCFVADLRIAETSPGDRRSFGKSAAADHPSGVAFKSLGSGRLSRPLAHRFFKGPENFIFGRFLVQRGQGCKCARRPRGPTF